MATEELLSDATLYSAHDLREEAKPMGELYFKKLFEWSNVLEQ